MGLALATGAPASALALPIAYTDATSFLGNLPGAAQVLDFDSELEGTTIPSGTALGGVTFVYDFGGVMLEVSSGFDTTSAPNYLGSDDGGILQDGDDFDLVFSPKAGIGMFFLTADALFDGDITLSAGGASASLAAADLQMTLADGTDVYFLGLIDPAGTFSQASVTTIGGGFFLYNVDDVVTAIPEPAPIAMIGLGLAWMGSRRGRGRGPRASAEPSGVRDTQS